MVAAQMKRGYTHCIFSKRSTYNMHQFIHYRKVNLLSYDTSPLDTPNTCNVYFFNSLQPFPHAFGSLQGNNFLMLCLSNFKQTLLYFMQKSDCFKLCYVAVCLVFSKLQDPFLNMLRVVQQSACLDFHSCPYFFRQSQIQKHTASLM